MTELENDRIDYARIRYEKMKIFSFLSRTSSSKCIAFKRQRKVHAIVAATKSSFTHDMQTAW
jgi:hypothetical protein